MGRYIAIEGLTSSFYWALESPYMFALRRRERPMTGSRVEPDTNRPGIAMASPSRKRLEEEVRTSTVICNNRY